MTGFNPLSLLWSGYGQFMVTFFKNRQTPRESKVQRVVEKKSFDHNAYGHVWSNHGFLGFWISKD